MSESDDTELFYNHVRLIVVIFLFHVLIVFLSSILIKSFQCSNYSDDDSVTEKNDVKLIKFSSAVCSFICALSLSSYILLPLSIFLNEILILFPNNFYVQWIDTDLLKCLYISVHDGIKFSLFLIPFTCFLLQSSGITSNSLSSKFIESFLIMLILHSLIFIISLSVIFSGRLIIGSDSFIDPDLECNPSGSGGNSYFLYFDKLIKMLNTQLTFFEKYQLTINFISIYVHLTYSIFSFIGLIVSLISTPIGLISILLRIFKLFQSSIPVFVSRVKLKKRLNDCKIDRDYYDLAFKCKSMYPIESRYSKVTQAHIQKVDYEIAILERHVNRFYYEYLRSWSRPILYFTLLAGILLTLGTVIAFVFMNILELSFGIVWNVISFVYDSQIDLSNSYFGRYFLFSDFSIGVKSSSKLGHFGAFIQVILIHFLLITSVYGFFDGPIANKLKVHTPTKRNTSVFQLLANVSALLLLTSALPLQAVLLGFTAINPPADIYNPQFTPYLSEKFNEHLSSPDPFSDDQKNIFSWITSIVSWPMENKEDAYYSRRRCTKDLAERSFSSSMTIFFSEILPSFFSAHQKDVDRAEKFSSGSFFDTYVPPSPIMPKFSQTSWNLLILLCYNIGFLATTIWIFKRKKSQDPTTEEFWQNIRNLISPLASVRPPWAKRLFKERSANINRKLSTT